MKDIQEQHIHELINDKDYDAAVKVIVELYSQRLYAHVIRMVKDDAGAKDVLQNTMLKVWKGLKGFRKEAKLGTWIYRIATNETIDYLRKQKRIQTSQLTEYSSASSSIDIDGKTIQDTLQLAIDTLPIKQKQVFVLRYFDEMKYQEMSAMLGTSEGALKASYHHAVKKIEQFIKSR